MSRKNSDARTVQCKDASLRIGHVWALHHLKLCRALRPWTIYDLQFISFSSLPTCKIRTVIPNAGSW